MSTNRLSRLQKWVLVTLLDQKHGWLTTHDIYVGYYRLVNTHGVHFKSTPYGTEELSRRTHSAWPVVWSSLRRLVTKGLIDRGEALTKGSFGGWNFVTDCYIPNFPNAHYDRWDSVPYGHGIRLTDAGREQALKLKDTMNHGEHKDKDK